MVQKSNSNKADDIIRNHILWSMGAGLIWVPIVDFLAVSAIQLDMVRQLCKLHDKDFGENQGKAIISSLTSSGLSKIASRAVKFIPGIGTILGGITMSVVSGASTYALGQVFHKHFESGGTLLDFDPKAFQKKYDEWFEKGKEYAENLKKNGNQPTSENATRSPESDQAENMGSNRTTLDQLKEIGELKEKGIITEDEFQNLKTRILGKTN